MKRTRTFNWLAIAALLVAALPVFAQNTNNHYATQYAYVMQNGVYTGNGSTGSSTITLVKGTIALPNGRVISPFSVTSPIIVGTETVTPTAVSNCYNGAPIGSCTITATFVSLHGPGETVQSATAGLNEAVYDAWNNGGGSVIADTSWVAVGGTTALINAAIPYSNVYVSDIRGGVEQYWTVTQAGTTVLAAPTTLTAVTVGFGLNGGNTTSGTYTGASTYHYCIAYVDVAGQEGPCSADFSAATAGTGTTNQIGFAAPAASTGAVGYTAYISLAAGTYNLTYQVPITSSVCTLTRLETVTPACAVVNATYGQLGSTAQVSALTVNTAPLHLLATTASTTAAYIGTPNGRTLYAYVPHSAVGLAGVPSSMQAFTISPAPATTVPTVLGTINLPAGFMNLVGRTIRVCGEATNASGGTATVENIELLWDAAGSNTAGAPVIVGQMQITATQASSPENYSFCETLQTTVAGAGVTAGSVQPVFGNFTLSEAAGTLHASGPDVKAAAVGSLNLAGTGGNTQRLHIVYLHTTGTDATGTTLQGLTVEAL